ncbi:hypothetical protein R0J87_13500 [Halomonas sp. SIMBA_159]
MNQRGLLLLATLAGLGYLASQKKGGIAPDMQLGKYLGQAADTVADTVKGLGIPYKPGAVGEGSGLELGWLKDWAMPDTTPIWESWDMTTRQPRGIRNNNPGNIEYTGTQWQGLDDPPTDGRFMRFVSPAYGIRALTRVLNTYQSRHGLNTIRGIIDRWAPSFENNTSAYVNSVAAQTGIGADAPLNTFDPGTAVALAAAIIKHENGQQPYSVAQLRQGVSMA